jgi:long-chain acyl-CoA synthetase
MGQTFCVPAGRDTGLIYSKPVGAPATDNETAAYRYAAKEDLLTSPDNECKTAYDLFQHGLKVCPDGECIGWKKADGPGYEWLTYSETFRRSKNVGSGLIGMDLCPVIQHAGEKYSQSWRFIGIITKNRMEFALLEQAANCYGITLVPIYDTLGPETLHFICEQTKLRTIFCAHESVQNVVKSVGGKSGHDLKNIVVFGEPTKEEIDMAAEVGLKVLPFAEIETSGEKNVLPVTPPKPEDVNTFCYTSGTTGLPKGAMITHAQFVAMAAGVLALPWLNLQQSDVHLSYLPIAHILERIVNQCFFYLGAKTGYYRGDTLKIVDDCQELRPTVFVSVPRLYNRIYDKVMAGAEAAGGLKKKLFDMALNSKLERVRQDGCVTHALWDRIVFSKPKAILGGNVRIMLTGAAPISAHVHDALKCIFCVPIAEGYGMTESTGASCLSNIADPHTGHVGGPVPCIELKLISVPEMSYSVHDVDPESGLVCPRGEICFRGGSVFPGYFMDPEKTKEALGSDGWLRTGDIGVIRPDGSLKIIDRRKNIFKLAQGEYVAAEKIEMAYQESPSIGQCFIYGKSTETFVVAIVVPDVDHAKFWWSEHKKTEFPGLDSVCQDKDFSDHVKAEMATREKEAKLNGFEKAKKFHISPEAFTVENNLLTPTFKLKRKETRERYIKEIESMYA